MARRVAGSSFLPGYASSIADAKDKQRYAEKIAVVGCDPYEISKAEWDDNTDMWPSITYVHVCMHLIINPSPYTKDDMLNYKSLDSFKNFQDGWVREVLVKSLNQRQIVIGKVNHSQRLSEKPLTPWIIAEKDGRILGANCDCMAGLGESCSHIATLLWAIAAGVERRESLTVTQKSAYWVMPPAIKTVPYAPIADIAFTGKKRRSSCNKGNSDPSSDHSTRTATVAVISPKKQSHVSAPTDEEKVALYKSLSTCVGAKPVVLAIIPPFSDAYIPSSLAEDLPTMLSELYNKDRLSVGYSGLLQLAKNTDISVTSEQVKAVEVKTRHQAESRLWFRMRAGRITASKFKSACCTDPAAPSKSLIMSVCYPELFQFSTAATKWGCQHEKLALEIYSETRKKDHQGLKLSTCGLFICADHPFLGASPDGIVECKCCGQGTCEVKCPFCHRQDKMDEAMGDKTFCLEKLPESDGQTQLKRNHTYYYQVQAQLQCTGLRYCDFVVYTEEDIHIERIEHDPSFLESNLPKAKHFFLSHILPELLGHWYSRPPAVDSFSGMKSTESAAESATDIDNDLGADTNAVSKYCYCQGGEHGQMVGCDNSECPYQWFHLDCLNLKNPPKGKIWYCPDCRKLDKFKRKSKQKLK